MALAAACRAEKAIQARALPALASEYRTELAALSAADYTGHTLLQVGILHDVCCGFTSHRAKEAVRRLSQVLHIVYTSHTSYVVLMMLALLENQLKKQALVLDLLHYCEVAEELAAASPSSTSEWAWTRQLRYYAAKVSADSISNESALCRIHVLCIALSIFRCMSMLVARAAYSSSCQ